MTTPNVNSNIFRLLAQQWAQTTYADESRYNINTRNIPRNFWNALYAGDIYGNVNSSNFSLPSDQITNPTFPGVLPDYSEIEFYLAEAVERGFYRRRYGCRTL